MLLSLLPPEVRIPRPRVLRKAIIPTTNINAAPPRMEHTARKELLMRQGYARVVRHIQ
jgi:hypothetical protein